MVDTSDEVQQETYHSPFNPITHRDINPVWGTQKDLGNHHPLIADGEYMMDWKTKKNIQEIKKEVLLETITVRLKNNLQSPSKWFLHVIFYNIDSLSLCYQEN